MSRLPRTVYSAELQGGSDRIHHEHVETIESICKRIDNLVKLADLSDPSKAFEYMLQPILNRLQELGTGQAESIRQTSTRCGLNDVQSRLMEEKLNALLEPVRLSKLDEAEQLAGAIASILVGTVLSISKSSDRELNHRLLQHYRLFKDLEEAKGKAFADRRPWLNKALDGYFLLLTEVFNVAYQGHEGLEVVKNIAALDLARVVFDFKQDSDSLYAVRIYFERKHILDSLGNHGIHLTMSPLIASTREPSSFSISDPMKRIEDVYRAVQFKGSPEGLHKIITQLDGIEATLKENIQQNGGWDSFRTRCPPWSPCNSNISAAVLINQVLLKWYNLHGKLTSIGLEESEQAFVTIFKETGLEYKLSRNVVFVPENRNHLNPKATPFTRPSLNPKATVFKP